MAEGLRLETERQTAVLLHSSGMSSRQWNRLAEPLARTHRVIAPDLLGSGASPPWPDGKPFDLMDDVAVIERLIEGVGAPVHLVGHSYGGLLAVTVARRSPASIRSLAVYDPVAFGVLHEINDAEGLADLDRIGRDPVFTDFEKGGNDAWFEAFVDYWNGVGAWRGMTQSGRESFLRVGRKVFYEVASLSRDRTPACGSPGRDAPGRGFSERPTVDYSRGRSHGTVDSWRECQRGHRRSHSGFVLREPYPSAEVSSRRTAERGA